MVDEQDSAGGSQAPRAGASGDAELPADPASRRGFLGRSAAVAMGGGLAVSYGTFFAFSGRFLYPGGPGRKAWMFVAVEDTMGKGEVLPFRTPTGKQVHVARQGETGKVEDFIALSSTCPHLGCQVHWEPHNDRFFCPCHNGVFDPGGTAKSGPPADAGQTLPRYPLMLDQGLLFIEVDLDAPAAARER